MIRIEVFYLGIRFQREVEKERRLSDDRGFKASKDLRALNGIRNHHVVTLVGVETPEHEHAEEGVRQVLLLQHVTSRSCRDCWKQPSNINILCKYEHLQERGHTLKAS